MGLNLEYPPGATPLDPDDAAGLIPSHITTQGQLNEWEFQNVAEPLDWGSGDLVASVAGVAREGARGSGQ